MKCPKCQFENPHDAKFCIECANPIEFHCPNCGEITPATGRFCKECGYDLKKPKEEPTPINYSEPQSYTPKHLTEKILNTRSSIEGERKLVTVLFADVANYTSMSEKLDAEEIHQIMDGCFKILMDEIHRYEGTINQFTGDGVMALFGAPVAHEDHAQRACQAALAIQKAMDEYSQKIEKDCNIAFKLRIGLNSGPVIVGAIGDDLRMDYTAVGDTTNLAMRMESITEPGSVQISENTYRLIKSYFNCEDRGSVSVKGKEDPQHRYILLKSSDVKTRIDASVSKGLVRFVGRKNSMATVRNAWDKAINGSGQVLGVVGEAGVGKSRLLLEFREALENTDFNYFEGRCIHYGGSMAYLPILDILKTFFKIEEGQREYIIKKSISEKLTTLDAERLTDSRPAFQDLLSIKVEDESWLKLEPKIRKEHTFEALRNLFIRLSEERPLIIAVEDLHWMDKTSEEFLTYFINSLAHSPVLLILLYRPEYTHQWGSKSYYSKIGLDQLTMKSSAELVSAILEGGEVASDLTEHILNRSAGNPLFMEEFTYALLENGSIERKDNQFVLTENFENIQVPDTIQGIIAARMDRLEDSLKRTMQVASVIGRDFAFRILQTITGMREELKSYLMNLQGLEFIYEKSLFPELEYIFKHALTQEVAYNSLLLAKRKNIHERIGKAIEEIYSNRLDELYEMLAYHFSKSENLEKAYHYLKLAGQKAYRNNANWDAYRFYEKAITLLEKMPESDENTRNKIETCLLIAAPSSVLGYPEKSLEILLQGESLSKRIGDRRSLARSCRNLAHCFSIRGDHQKSMQYSERCFQDAKEIEDVGLTATVARELCLSHFWYGNLLKMAEIAIPAISLLEEKEKQYQDFDTRSNTYSALCAYCVQAYGLLGDFAEAKSFYDKGIKIVNELNDKYGIAWIYFCYAVSCGLEGNGKICIQLANDAIKKTEEVGAAALREGLWMTLGCGYTLIDKSEEAILLLESRIDKQEEISSIWLPYYYWALSEAYLSLGELVDSQRYANEGLKATMGNDAIAAGTILKILAGFSLWRNDRSQLGRAKSYINEGIKIGTELKLKPWFSRGYLYLGEIYLDTGQKELASENLKIAEKNFREMGSKYWLKKVQEVLNKI